MTMLRNERIKAFAIELWCRRDLARSLLYAIGLTLFDVKRLSQKEVLSHVHCSSLSMLHRSDEFSVNTMPRAVAAWHHTADRVAPKDTASVEQSLAISCVKDLLPANTIFAIPTRIYTMLFGTDRTSLPRKFLAESLHSMDRMHLPGQVEFDLDFITRERDWTVMRVVSTGMTRNCLCAWPVRPRLRKMSSTL